MRVYLSLGHISKVENHDRHVNYMPHHVVVKLDSATTKYRPVFNASVQPDYDEVYEMPKRDKVTFNQTLMIGPTIQNDRFEILILFRVHRFALIADIEKMYRQILIYPEDRKYQHIFWREDKTSP